MPDDIPIPADQHHFDTACDDRPHLFAVDQGVPADQQGRHACATCHCMGEPGDVHHALPDAPMDVQQLRAGESGTS